MQLKESKEVTEKKIKKERRTFLKRAVYAAPSLVLLGSLVKPTTAYASCVGLECPIGTPTQ